MPITAAFVSMTDLASAIGATLPAWLATVAAGAEAPLTLIDQLAQFDALIGFLITWAGGLFVWLRARSRYAQKSFRELVNFSLNDIRDGGLVLRTLHEASALDVFLAKPAIAQIMRAADATAQDQPFLSIRDDDDWSFCQRAALNVLSQLSAQVYLARAMGAPARTESFVFGITFEKYGEMKTRKLRVILIRRELLEKYFLPTSEPFDFKQLTLDESTHTARIATLKTMGQLFASDQPEQRRRFRTVELGVPGA